MKLSVKSPKENPVSILRRAGYAFQRKEGDEMSFVRPFGSAGYPRFHIYAKIEKNYSLTISIHLDQKKETYGDVTRHHGEYGNDGALKDEIARIGTLIEGLGIVGS
jgi:hypothetical protein